MQFATCIWRPYWSDLSKQRVDQEREVSLVQLQMRDDGVQPHLAISANEPMMTSAVITTPAGLVRVLNFSAASSPSPRPVASAVRSQISWTPAISGKVNSETHNKPSPNWAPACEYVATPDAAGAGPRPKRAHCQRPQNVAATVDAHNFFDG